MFKYIHLLFITLSCPIFCLAITNTYRNDGFGAQYQNIIYCYAFAEMRGCPFYYTPLTVMEHNYLNEDNFLEKKELLMGFKTNLPLYNSEKTRQISRESIFKFVQENFDKFEYSNALKNVKKFFYEGKCREDYIDESFFNVAIHIRRSLKDDTRDVVDCDDWVNKIINILTKMEFSRPLKIHIISVGEIESFKKIFGTADIEYHLDTQLNKIFVKWFIVIC